MPPRSFSCIIPVMRGIYPFVGASLLLGVAFLIYGAFIEPVRLSVTTVEIHEGRLARILAGRKVALLSDLHFNDNGEPIAEAALQRLDEIRPDLILLAGDYVAWGSRAPAYELALNFLAQLRAPLGVFAVLGDADSTLSRKSCEFCHQPGSGDPTDRHPVVFLKDARQLITTPLGEFLVIGLDPERGALLTSRVREMLDGDQPALLLSHTSRIFRMTSATREILVLSGDTHGGQVRLPGWLWRLTGFIQDPAHRYGLFREGEKALFVTRGLGTSRVRFRLGAPPELVVLEFNGPQFSRAIPVIPALPRGQVDSEDRSAQ